MSQGEEGASPFPDSKFPAKLSQIVTRALEECQDHRYDSVRDMQDELKLIVDDLLKLPPPLRPQCLSRQERKEECKSERKSASAEEECESGSRSASAEEECENRSGRGSVSAGVPYRQNGAIEA